MFAAIFDYLALTTYGLRRLMVFQETGRTESGSLARSKVDWVLFGWD